MVEIIFDENEDWEKRVLCIDESCIGTIGPDGKCKECGKVYEGKLPERHDESVVQTVTAEKEKHVEPTGKDTDDDWDQRVLCRDGACIGVIGDDGKCKECGKPGS
ncbi:MAG: hypothetical protein CVU54_17800 [Deltaproteobacteria bacterium HGW-Deltaproteobacteria-12]|nr:MAG: hypothetical protein CVU54_17800 [Deltaproteobacteria bacterium HGW-Deltaproteobacteria-12]